MIATLAVFATYWINVIILYFQSLSTRNLFLSAFCMLKATEIALEFALRQVVERTTQWSASRCDMQCDWRNYVLNNILFALQLFFVVFLCAATHWTGERRQGARIVSNQHTRGVLIASFVLFVTRLIWMFFEGGLFDVDLRPCSVDKASCAHRRGEQFIFPDEMKDANMDFYFKLVYFGLIPLISLIDGVLIEKMRPFLWLLMLLFNHFVINNRLIELVANLCMIWFDWVLELILRDLSQRFGGNNKNAQEEEGEEELNEMLRLLNEQKQKIK